MRELDDAALELQLRRVLKAHLGSLPLDITVDDLEHRRQLRDRTRRRRGWIELGLAAAFLLPVGGLLMTGGRPPFLANVAPTASATPKASTPPPTARPSAVAPTSTPAASVEAGRRDLLVSTDTRGKIAAAPCVNLDRYAIATGVHRRLLECADRVAIASDATKAAIGGTDGLPIIDLDDGRQVGLIEVGEPVFPILWSPTGRWLQFAACGSDANTNDPCKIMIGSPDNDHLSRLPGGEGGGFFVARWLPDESHVLVPADATGGMLIGNADGSGLVPLDSADTATQNFLAAPKGQGAISPDGTRWASAWGPYVGGHTPVIDLLVASRDGTDARNLTNFAPGDSVTEIAWSPDGRTIAFVKCVGCQSESQTGRPRHELWLAEESGSQRTIDPVGSLAPMPGTTDIRLTWSPDGSRLAVEAGNGDATSVDVLIVAVNGSPMVVLQDAREASWSPDGGSLAVVGTTGPASRRENDPIPPATIDVANADGSNRRTIAIPKGDLDAFSFLWAAR